jgi:hypothetical protein
MIGTLIRWLYSLVTKSNGGAGVGGGGTTKNG